MVCRSSLARRGDGALRIAGLGMTLVFALLAACSSGAPTSEADLAAIEEFNRRYVQAINDGDAAALAALTTEDHIMLMPNRPPLIGKDANIEAMAAVFEQSEIDEAWIPEETVVAGDWAYQRGTFTVGFRPKGGDAEMSTTTGNFLRIYRRQPDGEWRMIRDMFNTYDTP